LPLPNETVGESQVQPVAQSLPATTEPIEVVVAKKEERAVGSKIGAKPFSLFPLMYLPVRVLTWKTLC